MVTLAGCGGYQQAGEGTQAVESALMVSTDRLFPDDMLFKGQRLVSAGCLNRVEMQNDGNLVMYNAAGQVTFATSRYHVPDPNISFGCRGDYWIFQSDDNGVLYNRNAASSSDTRWATFATNTEILHVFGYPTFMRVTSDGFFRVSSNTGGADATAWSVGQQQNAAQPAHCPNPSRLTRIRRGWSMSGTPYKTLQINDGYGGLNCPGNMSSDTCKQEFWQGAQFNGCGHWCAQDPSNCKAWYFDNYTHNCFLESSYGSLDVHDDARYNAGFVITDTAW